MYILLISSFYQQEDAQRREEKLEEAKRIVIKEDTSLPKAEVVRISFIWFSKILSNSCILYNKKKQVKIKDVQVYHDKRVKVFGWVHRIRRQGKK